MKKILVLVLALCLFVPAAFAGELKFIAEFEGGKLYKAGELNVVVMKGNFYQMGRQYGELLRSQFNEFYDMAAKQAEIGTKKNPYDEVVAVLKTSLDKQPFYVREWVRGMSETTGFGMDKQTIACQMLVPLLMSSQGCSGMIAWGEYTKGGSTVIGRNWDLPGNFLLPYQKFLTVAVFNPVGSGQGVADINYIGQTLWQSAMNQSGLFYDLQNGQGSDPFAAKNRLNSNSALMSMMLDSTSLDQVEAFFDAVRAEGGIIINAADAKQGFTFEWGTSDYRKRVDDPKGLLAASNHFVDPSWRVAMAAHEGKAGGFSLERCANLLAMGKKYKGEIDAARMMEIFDTTIPQGGPSFYPESGFRTYYSIVAVPKGLKLWLNARDFQGWTEIDLGPLFK